MISQGERSKSRVLSSFVFRAGVSTPLVIGHLRVISNISLSIISDILLPTEANLKNGDVFNV